MINTRHPPKRSESGYSVFFPQELRAISIKMHAHTHARKHRCEIFLYITYTSICPPLGKPIQSVAYRVLKSSLGRSQEGQKYLARMESELAAAGEKKIHAAPLHAFSRVNKPSGTATATANTPQQKVPRSPLHQLELE